MFSLLRARPQSTRLTQKKSSRDYEVFLFRELTVQIYRRPYRRSIGVTLQVSGRVRVSAPKTASLQQIAAFLESHVDWIHKNLKRYESLRSAHPPKQFREGEKLIFMGQELTLLYRERVDNKSGVKIIKDGEFLICEIPPLHFCGIDIGQPHPELAPAFVEFYRRAGRSVLEARVALFARKMNLYPSSLSFRSQKTRWGSCSSRGRVSLNWRLIIAPLEVIDYVIVHELSHLKFYSHSQEFWDLVATQVPNYLELRDWLRANQYKADFLAKKSELHG